MDLIGFLRRNVLKEDDEWNSGARWRLGDFDFVCACLSKQHTKFLQGKEVNFFSKEDETKERLLLFCALLFLSLSLSLCFLSYKRSSLR